MQKHLVVVEKNPSGTMGLKKAKQLGLFVTFISANKYHNKITKDDMQYIDRFIQADTNKNDLIIDMIDNINKEHHIDGVITFLDYYVPLVAKISEHLNLPGMSFENALCARNKYLMRNRHKRDLVSIPMYIPVKNLNEAINAGNEIQYPNIIKPINLSASRNVFKNNNALELKENYFKIKNTIPPFGINNSNIVLVEEYMDGPEYSVEAIVFNGEISIVGITKKQVSGHNSFVEVNHTVPAMLSENVRKKIEATTILAIKSIGIRNGCAHTEIKATSKGPKIVEIAARLGGDHIPELIERAFGIDLWSNVIKIALGEKPILKKIKNKVASIQYITGKPGIIYRIDNSCKLSNDIKVVHLDVQVGDTINELNNSSDRLGYFIAECNDYRDLNSCIKNTLENIKIYSN